MDQNLPCLRQRNRRRLPKRPRSHQDVAATTNSSQHATPTVNAVSQVATHEGNSPALPSSDAQSNESLQINDGISEKTATGTLEVCLSRFQPQRSLENELNIWDPPFRPIITGFNMPAFQDNLKQQMIHEAQQALQSALANAAQALPMSNTVPSSNGDTVERLEPPSPEFLTWMLQDIGSAKGGSYVWDYFKHVSKSTLKRMGLAILSNKASADEKHIFTVCLSGAAHKFLKTILASGEHDDELTEHLQQRLLIYKQTALVALDRIPLTTTPSLALLQALLCGIFIHQGSGNARTAYNLTRTACRVATDLGYHQNRAEGNNSTTEESFCVLWCYMLDQNFAWKFEAFERFFDPEPGVIDHHCRGTTSGLLTIYIMMSQVQDTTISLLRPPMSTGHRPGHRDLHRTTEQLLAKMEDVRQQIQQIAFASPEFWKGLDHTNEIAALQFAHNSIRTTVIYLSEHSPEKQTEFGESLLLSARQELSSLVGICLISEKNNAVAFLHWTLMYYPLTAWFVLFCNSITSSHYGDLDLLKTLATVLMPNVSFSHPITVIQRLCKDFIALSQSHFANMSSGISAAVDNYPCPPSRDFLRNRASISPAIASSSDNTSGLFTSDLYQMYPTNENNTFPIFDLPLTNTLSLDLSDEAFLCSDT